MREILFRGKRIEDGKWFFGSLVHRTQFYGIPADDYFILYDGEFHCDFYGSAEVDPKTLGQYSGLTDKNGKKIFEGDICKHRSNYSGEYVISVVTYTDGCFLAMSDNNSGFNLSDKLEIIGNIHDNPELLKGGAEE